MPDDRLTYPYDNLTPERQRRREANAAAMRKRVPDAYAWYRAPWDRESEQWAFYTVLAQLGVHEVLVDELGHRVDVERYLRHLWSQGRNPGSIYQWQLSRVALVIERGLLPGWQTA